MRTEPWWQRNRRALRASLIVLQWFLLTIALGAVIVRTERTFEGLVSPRFDSSSVFIAAFVAALLLGLTIESPRMLIAAVTTLCVGAALLFVLMLYIPVWEGTVLRTRALDNFALGRFLVLLLLMALPAAVGGVAGQLLGGFLNPRHEVLPAHEMEQPVESWWGKRRDRA